jgi:hypothetical protein
MLASGWIAPKFLSDVLQFAFAQAARDRVIQRQA